MLFKIQVVIRQYTTVSRKVLENRKPKPEFCHLLACHLGHQFNPFKASVFTLSNEEKVR